MGCCCCGGDTVPPVPENMRPDPDAESPITAEVARLGYFGTSRDFGIWFEKRPESEDEQKNNIWMWFNKGDDPNEGHLARRIDLENFKRNPEDKEQRGKILYSAFFKDKPNFQVFQRRSSHGFNVFTSFFKNGRPDEQDEFYVNHPTHLSQLNNKRHSPGFQRMLDGCIISKWSFNSQVRLKDGNLGRGEAYFFGESPVLEIYSKGTVVTSYYETKHEVDGRTSFDVHKLETEFVDVIDFRLTIKDLLIAEWTVDGDSYKYGNDDVSLDTPLFTVNLKGGWFSRSVFQITTKSGLAIDSALALLVAHVACTEFSVAEIKRDLKVRTPARPPMNFEGLLPFDNSKSVCISIQVRGTYTKGHKFNDTHNPMSR